MAGRRSHVFGDGNDGLSVTIPVYVSETVFQVFHVRCEYM